MKSISIKFDANGLKLSSDDRWELARIVDKVLQDSDDLWVGSQYAKDSITIHALVENEKLSINTIRLAIVGHPAFFINSNQSM